MSPRCSASSPPDSAADVYGTAIETFQAFAARGLFIPLDDYVKAHSDFSDFAPSLFEQSSFKGNIYYIPISWNNIMINYNRDLFDKAGVAYPKEGWTWDDFRETAKALTVKDASGNVTAVRLRGAEPELLRAALVPDQRHQPAQRRLDRLEHARPQGRREPAVPLRPDPRRRGLADPGQGRDGQPVLRRPGGDDQPRPLDRAGGEARRRSTWTSRSCRPRRATPRSSASAATRSPSPPKDPELAQALVSALTSLETQTEEGIGGGGVPGRAAAAQSKEFLEFPPSAFLYYQTLPHTKPVPSPANFQEVEKIFIRYYTAMMADEVSIADGVKQADAELNASFERLKKQTGN